MPHQTYISDVKCAKIALKQKINFTMPKQKYCHICEDNLTWNVKTKFEMKH